MSERDPKYLVGSRPVNRRTAPRAALAPNVAPVVVARLRAAQARHRLGAPLAEQLRTPSAVAHAPPSAGAVVGGIVTACGGIGVFLAWLQMSPLTGVAGLAGVVGGLLLVRTGKRVGTGDAQMPAAPLFDPAAVEAFDRAVQQLAGELPAEVVQPLSALKQLVVRMARYPGGGAPGEHFLVDDRLYANECLRRYLPDTLQAYLAVPGEQRGTALADCQTPQALLLAQLAQLHAEMQTRETKLARDAAQALLRQQRFLDAKKKG